MSNSGLTAIRLGDETKRRVRLASALREESMSEFIRRAVDRELDAFFAEDEDLNPLNADSLLAKSA